jgi:CHAD domain-containing protein
LFSCAGKIREAQLESALFDELQLTGYLGSYLKNKNARLRTDLSQFEKMAKNIHKKIKKHFLDLEPGFNKISREKIFCFADILNNQVTSMMVADEWTDEEIHELRKKLKELLYTINIFQFAGTESKSIDSLQDLIGKWHDKVVIAGKLTNKKLYKNINKEEKVTMRLVVENLNQSSVEMLEKIYVSIRKHQNGKTFLPARTPLLASPNSVMAGL